MSETQFIVPLHGSPANRYRHRHTLEEGTVTGFVIQYEAEIEGEWREIVRYDTAHGSPHKDIMHPEDIGNERGISALHQGRGDDTRPE